MAGRPTIASDYVAVILQAIEKAQSDPTQLRSLVYDLARISLGKHVLINYQQLGSGGLQQQLSALETAISQVESVSVRQDNLLAEEGSIKSIANSASSADQFEVLVRDQPDGSLTDDPPSENLPAVLYQGSDQTYRGLQQIPEYWPHVEILQPTFGSGPKDRQAKLSWGLQLGAAAIIGVAIYGLMLMRPDHVPWLKDFRQAQALPATAAATTSQQQIGQKASFGPSNASSLQTYDFPLPSVYGVYAVSDGKLVELDPLPMKVPDSRIAISAIISNPSQATVANGNLTFVIFRRDLASSAPMEAFVRVVARVARNMSFSANGPPAITKVDGQWAIRSKSYMYRIGPVGDNSEMIALHPQDPQLMLSPGRYVLVIAGKGYDFTVAGKITDIAQCIERTDVVGGSVYSECRNLP